MIDEIRQQPETLSRTLSSQRGQIERFRTLIARRKPRLIVLTARGEALLATRRAAVMNVATA